MWLTAMRFRTYLILALLLTTLTPLLAFSWVEHTALNKAIEDADAEQQDATMMAGELIKERLGFINHIATFARESLRTSIATNNTEALDKTLAQLLTSFSVLKNLHVDELHPNGEARVLAFESHDSLEAATQVGTDHSARWHAMVARARTPGEVYYSPMLISSIGVPTPLVTFAITDRAQHFVISGALLVSQLFGDIRERLEKRGLSLVVLDSNQQAIFPSTLSVDESAYYAQAPAHAILPEGLSGQMPALFTTTMALRTLDNALPPWTLIVTKPNSLRLGAHTALQIRTSFFGLAILILTMAVGWWMARPLYRALEKLDRDLDSTHFGTPETTITAGPLELRHYQSEYRQTRVALQDHMSALERMNTQLSDLVEARSRELTAQERLFSQVFEGMEDAILLFDEQWSTVAANASATAWLADWLTPSVLEALLTAAKAQQGESPTAATNTSGSSPSPVFLFSTATLPQGSTTSPRTLECRLFSFSSPKRQLAPGHGLLLRDITERAQLEQMKTDLIGIVAHELKTPITTCQLTLDALRARDERGNEADYQAMKDDLGHLQRIITDWLNVAKIDGGVFKVNPDLMLLTPTVNRAAALVRARHPFTLTTHWRDEAEVSWADQHAVIELLVNLFTNACRYARANTTPTITIRAERTPTALVITVLDAGVGIPAELREKIFDRFYQVNPGTTRRSGGTGLGLVISRAICRAHGGDIVATEIDGQTAFVITLPQPDALPIVTEEDVVDDDDNVDDTVENVAPKNIAPTAQTQGEH